MYPHHFWFVLYAIFFCITNSFIMASQANAIANISSFHGFVWQQNNPLPPKNFSARQKEAARIKKEKKEEETKEFNALFKEKHGVVHRKACDSKYIQVKIRKSQLLLHEACWNNNETAVKKIFHNFYNPNIQDTKGNTPLHIACYQKNSTIIRLLFDHPLILIDIKNKKKETPFFIACRESCLEIVQAFFFHMKKIPNRTKLLLKARNTFFELTPWHIACMNNDSKLFFLLLQTATEQFNLILFDFLYLKNSSDQTILHIACIQQQVDIASLLIELSNPNITDSEGSTPLHYAVENGCAPIIKKLLESPQIYPNIYNDNFLTPLQIACIKKDSACVQLLLTNLVVLPDKFSRTPPPLHIAVMNNDVATVKILLADVRTSKTILYQGFTPLRVALSNKNYEIVALLTNDTRC